MKILITNDDGINAPALPHFAAWAQRLGEVTVVAPKFEQSGKSQAINFHSEMEIKRVSLPVNCEAWAVDSTPADCVRFACVGLERSYDLVLSGINRGYNLGHDIAYSGTAGAIFEASRLNQKAIAFSTGVASYAAALAELDDVYAFIKDQKLLEHADLLNVNLPVQKSRGICITRQGGMYYSDGFEHHGNDMYLQVGDPIRGDFSDLSIDINALESGYISISPLTADRTDHLAFEKMKKRN